MALMTQGCVAKLFASSKRSRSFRQGKEQPSGSEVIPPNLAVVCQKLYGSNKHWKKKYGYHKRSPSETAMFSVKKLLGSTLSLRNDNAQVGETYAMINALNKHHRTRYA